MKKFRFSLESALTIRRFRKQEAAGVLGAAQARTLEALGRKEAAEARLAEIESALLPEAGGSVAAGEMVRRYGALERSREALAECRRELEARRAEEDRSRAAVLEARRREETILQLKRNEKDRYRRELEREDERVVQEFVNARYRLDRL